MSLTWDNLGGVEQIEENFGKLQQKIDISILCVDFLLFFRHKAKKT